jgi:hypothetical protein
MGNPPRTVAETTSGNDGARRRVCSRERGRWPFIGAGRAGEAVMQSSNRRQGHGMGKYGEAGRRRAAEPRPMGNGGATGRRVVVGRVAPA